MRRVAAGVVLGAAAGVMGIIVYELTGQLVGWLIVGVLLGIVAQLPHLSKGRWALWGLLGGGVIVINWTLSNWLQYYPILIAWPLLGGVFGAICARSGPGWKIGGGISGLLAGTLGMGILPLITMIILPTLGLPTTFDYDIDVLGFLVTGIFIGGTMAWLRGR